MIKITAERYQELSPARYPQLASEGYSVESPPDARYNCIAWAAGDVFNWWWPNPIGYWPLNVPKESTVTAFTLLFEQLGYTVCRDESLEEGYEKIALYALGRIVKHAARQLTSGRWTSKVGQNIDIEHTLAGLEGPFYGEVVRILKREL